MFATALARLSLNKRFLCSKSDEIIINLPNGETRNFSAGPSSELVKAAVDQFAKSFMKEPAVILMSETEKNYF